MHTNGQVGFHSGTLPSCTVFMFLATLPAKTFCGETEVKITRTGSMRLMVAQACLIGKLLLFPLHCLRGSAGRTPPRR